MGNDEKELVEQLRRGVDVIGGQDNGANELMEQAASTIERLSAIEQPWVTDEAIERAAERIAAARSLIWEELEDHGSDGENKTTYRRLARAALLHEGQ